MMKVLDFESMAKYDFMAGSLSFIAMGDTEEAVISAYKHLYKDAQDDGVRLDILLYIAKIYSKMGEIDASINLLFRALRYRRDEGRVYALLAYNFFILGDKDNAMLYYAMLGKWNDEHNGVLILDDEYVLDFTKISLNKSLERQHNTTIDLAWEYAFKGDTARSRDIISDIPSHGECARAKLELLMSLDIADGRESVETNILLDSLMDSLDIDVMRTIRLLECLGRYDKIVTLTDKVMESGLTTCRLRYMRAVALYNEHRIDEARRVLSRLSDAYGYVYPYIVTAKYMAEHTAKVTLTIYGDKDTDSDIRLIRDSEACRLVLTTPVEEWIGDIDKYSLIVNMYEDGIITDALGYVTKALMDSTAGLRILQDILLDREVQTAKMRMYIARNMLERTNHLMVVYMDMVNECDAHIDESMSQVEIADIRDKCALNLIRGE